MASRNLSQTSPLCLSQMPCVVHDKQRTMKLSPRLSTVAAHVLPSLPMADVGTDHGSLPVSLLLSGHVPRAIASDSRTAPLQRAEHLAAAKNLSLPSFEAHLSNGLAHLQPGEVATVTICGMGGGNMVRILSAHPPAALQVRRLVLQPNNAAWKVRQHLMTTDWCLVAEEMIADGGYFYPILVAERGACALSEAQLLLGPLLRQQCSPAYTTWVASEVQRLSHVVHHAQSNSRKPSESLQHLIRKLTIFEAEHARCGQQ